MSHLEKFYGTGVALVTPFHNDETIDFNSLEKLINYVITNGVNYVVTLGTTGETPTLSKKEKIEIAQFTIEKVAGRVPVVIGVGGPNTKEIVESLNELPVQQCDAILSVSPYYNKPSQHGIFQHFSKIAEATDKPIILYNVPGRTGRSMAADTVIQLANKYKHIVAIKDATGDMNECMQLVQNAPAHFMVLSGEDVLIMPQIACGMKGVISVAANYFAKDFSTMVQLCLENKFEEARALHYKMLPAIDLMFAENNPAGIKAFLALKEICKNSFRLPVVPVSDATQQAIEAYIAKY